MMSSLAAWFSAWRYIHIAAVMQTFGMTLFCAYLAPQDLRTRLRSGLSGTTRILTWLAFISSIMLFALQGGQMGGGWPQVISGQVWYAMLGTAYGEVWLWHMLIALAAVFAVGIRPMTSARHHLLLLAMAGLLASQALVGHAAMRTGLMGALQRLNQIVHLCSAGWWLGGLLPLLMCLPLLRQSSRQDALLALIRFSRGGHIAVALVIASGIINTVLILGQWPVTWSSLYQRLLLIKIAVVAVMVMLAVTNRYGVVPAMARHHPAAIRILTVLTLAEMVLGNLALVLVSIFATLEP